jgi:L-ribulose-5-phosphate 3-epimerase
MLNRRDFLKTGSTLVAGAAVAGIAGAAVARARPQPSALPGANTTAPVKLKKAVGYGMVGDGSTVMDKFKLLRELGFEGVEMDRPSGLDADEILKARDATGIAVHGIVDSEHWQHTLGDASAEVRAKGLEGLRTAIRDCHRFGGISVLLVPAVVNKAIPYDLAYERSQAEIRKALPLAEELKVKIAIENVWNQFLLSPMEAARYVDEFKSPWVGWHFDIGNVVNTGWPEQWIRILGTRICKLHIKDFSRQKRDKEGLWKGFDVELGDGDADYPAVMRALREVGYDGWATAEVGGGDAARLKIVKDQMDRILA